MQAAHDLNNSNETALNSTTTVDWRGVGLYLLLAFAISWAIFFLKFAGVPFAIRASAGMFGPALACVFVRLLRREGFADAGLRLKGKELAGIRGTWRLYLLAYLVPLLLLTLGFLLGALFQVQHWNLVDLYQKFVQQAHVSPSNAPQLFATQILFLLTIGVVITMVATFGEELGWRGYLLPRLAPLGAIRAAILVGIIWGFWHAPVIVLDGYEFNGLYPALGVPFFLLFTIPVSIVFAWLRFKTGSIWPTVLAHAVINTLAGVGIAFFFTWGNPYLAAPVGLFGLVPWFACALWLIGTGRIQNKRGVSLSEARA